MNLTTTAFILLSIAFFVMATGTLLNSSSNLHSFGAGLAWLVGMVCYVIDLWNNGKKDG